MKFNFKQSKLSKPLLLAALVIFGIYVLSEQNKYNLRVDAHHQKQNLTQEKLFIAQKNENLSLLAGRLLDAFRSDSIHDLNNELKQSYLRQLSNLADAISPYPIETNDTIIANKSSPEKGILFRTIAFLELPAKYWTKIKEEVDFAFADLKEINLSKFNLDEIQLEGADLRYSVLSLASIKCATLNKANLWGANLSGVYGTSVQIQHAMLNWANLNHALLQNSQLGSSHLNNSNLVNANLYGSNMRFCQIKGSTLSNANLEKVNLLWTDLSRSSLKSSNLKKTKLRSCNLEDVNFDGADMRGALLWDANFNRCILTNVKLDSAIVKEINWFDKLDNWNVSGVSDLRKTYRLLPHRYANGSYMLEKINVAKN